MATELFTQPVVPDLSLADLYGAPADQTFMSSGANNNTLVNPTIYGGNFEGATFRSAISGARVEIFPDPTRGFSVWNNEATPYRVLEVMVAGTNVGDVTLGNFSGGSGCQWDQSAGTFTISGILIAGQIHIPDRDTTTNSFHVNTAGTMWFGATETDFNANNNNAEFYVLNTGAFRAGSITTNFIDWGITAANTFTTRGHVTMLLPGETLNIETGDADGNVGIRFTRADGAGDPVMYLSYFGESNYNVLTLAPASGVGLHVNTSGNVQVGSLADTVGLTATFAVDGRVGIGMNTPTAVLEVSSALTTGASLRVYRDLAAASTNSALVVLFNDNATDDQATLTITHDAAATAFTLTQNNVQTAFSSTAATTTTVAHDFIASSLTTGSVARFYSNSADVSGRDLVLIHNDNALATGTVLLRLTQDANETAFSVTGANTTDILADFIASSLTTGSAGRFYSDSADVSARFILSGVNDNTAAVGATVGAFQQDAANQILILDHNATAAGSSYIDFQGTVAANVTNPISSLTVSGATTHHIQVEINGAKAWIAASTNDPS